MLYCPKCGQENPEDSLYCQNCGFSLSLVSRYIASPESIDSSTITFSKGYSLGKRYQIVEEIGRGGMGIVYRAKDLMLDDYVALKLLLPQLTTDAEILDRFKREVLAARKIAHPNVIKVYDIGETKDIFFISMEYLIGMDLKKKVKTIGALSVEEAINIITQICSGLEAAHRMGVVHRDIKPQNIFITKKNQVKLMDFGIARAGDMTGLTTAGTLVGTPEYMSPEQADPKKTIDSRTDIYSLGVVMYEMFCGRVPFRSDTPIETVIKHLMEEPESLRRANSKILPAIDHIVMKALHKDPNRRYQKAKEIAKDFEKNVLKRTETIDLREPETAAVYKAKEEPPSAKKIPVKEVPDGAVSIKKGIGTALIVGIAVIIIAVIGGYFLYTKFISPDKDETIASLMQKAQKAYNQEQFTSPPEESALKFANDILAIESENKFALDLKTSIAGKYRNMAEEDWKAKNWIEARTNYTSLLKVIPNDQEALSRIKEIRNKIEGSDEAQMLAKKETDDFNAAKRTNTLEIWQSFLQRYPRSEHRTFALNRIEQLKKVEIPEEQPVAQNNQILSKREADDFAAARRTDNLEGWQNFLRRYPNSKQRSYAQGRIQYLNQEKRSFDQANKENSLEKWRSFLAQYPRSRYASQARQKIQQLQSTPGSLAISAYPLAEAYLDGEKIGNTPPVINLEIKPGKHVVKLEIKDYETYTKEVNISPNKKSTVHYVFKPFGTLVINSIPWAYISVDGKDKGATPLTIKKIAEGEHQVKLSREGFKTLNRTVNIKARDTTRLVLNMERE